MKVKDIMSKAHIVDKSDRISEALDLMDKYHSRRLVVKNKEGVQGIITLRSICGELGSRRKSNHPPTLFHVVDAISNDYALIGPEEDAMKAIDALKNVGCVIVVGSGVLGQVSSEDVLSHFTPGRHRRLHHEVAGRIAARRPCLVHQKTDDREGREPGAHHGRRYSGGNGFGDGRGERHQRR